MMSETTTFTIGSEVRCNDGVCGELTRVVVDPIARALTHLVVEPRHRGMGHLVPIDLVDSTRSEIQLQCDTAEFEALEDAEETQFIPSASELSWRYYDIGKWGMGGVGTDVPTTITQNRVPVGEVEVRRGEHVHATDGAIGRVQGLAVDPSDHHVTHVLLDQGHLWGQKRVAIPMTAVAGVDDGVRLNLTKDEVRDLPPVDLDQLT